MQPAAATDAQPAHNRRWDGDYLTIRDLIGRGLIGDIFHIECGQGNFSHPGFWWRSDRAISGGVMHDWGAHFLDWILNLVPSKITQVTGDFQKRVWNAVTNEDHGQAYIRFENGVTADYWISSIAAISRPKWLILGTKGSDHRGLEGRDPAGILRVRRAAGQHGQGHAARLRLGAVLPQRGRPPAAGRGAAGQAGAGTPRDRGHRRGAANHSSARRRNARLQ